MFLAHDIIISYYNTYSNPINDMTQEWQAVFTNHVVVSHVLLGNLQLSEDKPNPELAPVAVLKIVVPRERERGGGGR